jgi:hypothetical protein
VHLHGFTLSLDNIPDSVPDIRIFPQPAGTTMTRPTLSIRRVNPQRVQVAARVRFESVHDSFRINLRFHYGMNVIGSHVCCPEIPALVQTDFAKRREYCRTAVSIQEIRCLVHLLALHRDTLRIGCR